MTMTIRDLMEALEEFEKDGVDPSTPVCLYNSDTGENENASQVRTTTRDHELGQDDEVIIEIM